MAPKKQFGPASLRALLAVALVLIVAGGGALFYWGLGFVREFATEVSQSTVDAEASGRQINQLQVLKGQIAESDTLISTANQLFAAPASYQSQVLNDIKNYADVAGLTITSTEFSDPAQTGTYTISVTFGSPASYSGLISFLNNVEGNLPKLQINELLLGHADDGDANSVSIGEVKIDILVR